MELSNGYNILGMITYSVKEDANARREADTNVMPNLLGIMQQSIQQSMDAKRRAEEAQRHAEERQAKEFRAVMQMFMQTMDPTPPPYGTQNYLPTPPPLSHHSISSSNHTEHINSRLQIYQHLYPLLSPHKQLIS